MVHFTDGNPRANRAWIHIAAFFGIVFVEKPEEPDYDVYREYRRADDEKLRDHARKKSAKAIERLDEQMRVCLKEIPESVADAIAVLKAELSTDCAIV